ncbi:hypothetical protein [Sphingomonas sp.]|uniref:hypothetical protein n=1 Tax=Sphingomonas sp. TaxID=28214 RepID=UPI00286D902D|nr:hypothetical protein [Sphingomonas sp.]
MRALWIAAVMCTWASAAGADNWAAPQVKEVFSSSRDHFVRVTPGTSFGDTFGFAGSPKGAPATAEFYRRHADRSYRLTATAALLNPVAPVDFFVSDAGQLATIDNWHNVGYGRVVALYDAHGKPVKSYALEDLFTAAEIAAFGHSVSSRAWHQGTVYINRDQRTLYLMVASGRDLILGLDTGRYAYCETRGGQYLCRTTNADRQWRPYAAAVPDR